MLVEAALCLGTQVDREVPARVERRFGSVITLRQPSQPQQYGFRMLGNVRVPNIYDDPAVDLPV